MASLARSLIKKGVGRLIPGVGLILTAVEVADYLKDVDMGETDASKLANYGGQVVVDAEKKRTKRSLLKKGKKELQETNRDFAAKNRRKMGQSPIPRIEEEGQHPRTKGAIIRSAMEEARTVKSSGGTMWKVRAGSGSSRPSTVDTQSKKPLAKRIMEALGDNRNMEQATRDRKMTEEMEMEREMNVAGRKKGGMAKKKKAPVKKAYGGMVKKKHGGSANKVNMKAGFTRRGCSKG
jgi:hypothetical protein